MTHQQVSKDELFQLVKHDSNSEHIQKLIDANIDINQIHENTTLLHTAVFNDCIDIATYLLKARANVNSSGMCGSTPLCITRSIHMTRLLLDKKADIHRKNNARMSPVFCCGHQGSLMWLIRAKADIHSAQTMWYFEQREIETLLMAKVDPHKFRRPLHGHILEILLQAKAYPHTATSQ
jgi:ankyrin repeat protein